ncbi:MAG: hypothetical protein H6912_05085 [Kordiimonadaceae bacterium]|nr:hypothetical protein [Kordiimonadaceae bacterium]
MDWIISTPLILAAIMGLILSLYNIRDFITLLACSFALPLCFIFEPLIIKGDYVYFWILVVPIFWFSNIVSGLLGYAVGHLIIKYKKKIWTKKINSSNPQTKKALTGVLAITFLYFACSGFYDYFQWHFVTRDYFDGRIPLSAKVIFKERKDEGRSGYYSLAYQFSFEDYQNFNGCSVVPAHSLKEIKELDRLGLPLKIFGILPDDEQICTNITMEKNWGLILIARKTGAVFIQWNFD